MSCYTVMKDGLELKEYKSLPAAKKLADADGAEVFCDGECVYSGTETVSEVSTPVKYRLKALMNVRKEPSIFPYDLCSVYFLDRRGLMPRKTVMYTYRKGK